MECEKTKRILAALDRHEVNYVLGGGMAMAAQGLVRAARDIGVVSVEAKRPHCISRWLTDLLPESSGAFPGSRC